MTFANCPKCGSSNVTTAGVCANCGWTRFPQVMGAGESKEAVYELVGEIEIKVTGKALLDDYKRLLFENNSLTVRIAELEEIDRMRSESVSTLNQANANNEDEIELLEKRIAELTECIGSQMADVYTLKARIAELEEDKRSLRDSNLWLKQNYEDLERDYGVMHEKMCARIDKLKGAIEILEDQQREAKNILIDKNLHIDSLYEDGFKLQKRITELESLVDELKPYRDGYEGEFLEPTDDRFYLIRHTNGQLVTTRKVDNHEDINFLGWGAKGKPRRYWRLPEVHE